MKISWRWGIICLCLGLAFLLRVYGLHYGLPFQFHPDEDQYVDEAIKWHITNQRIDYRFFNPPLFTYILVGAFKLWLTLSPFEASEQWITGAYMFARLWSVGFGLATVALIYPVAKRLGNYKTGLLAMILFTGLFLPARESHFAVNDTAVTFFTLLTIYFSLKILRHGRLWDYLAAGGAVGLATASKYMGGLAVCSLLVAHGLTALKQAKWTTKMVWQVATYKYLWLSLLVALGIFSAISYFYILNFQAVLNALSPHLGVEGYLGTQMAPTASWQFYLESLGWGMGWLMLAGAVLAIGVGLFYAYRPGLVLFVCPILLFMFMSIHKIVFARYLLPAYPPLVVFVAVGLSWLAQRWRFLHQNQRFLWPVISVVLVAQPLFNLVWFDYLLTLPDTRVLATRWFMERFPPQTLVAVDEFSILPWRVFIHGPDWPYAVVPLNTTYHLQTKNDLGHFLTEKAEVVILNNFISGRVRQAPAEEQARQEQLAFWRNEAVLLQTFNPYRQADEPGWLYQDQFYAPAGETLQRVLPGPLINIYRLPYEKQPYRLEMPYVPQPIQANFAGKLMLLGYELNSLRAQPGGKLTITLYWQAISRMNENYVSFSHLLNAQQQNRGGYDRLPQERSKTTLWIPGEVVIDTFDIPVSTEATAGVYTVDIGLYNQADPLARSLPISHNNQPTGQNSIRLGPVKVGGAPPGATLPPSQVMPQHPLAVNLGEPAVISLRGYDLRPQADSLHLTLYWASQAQTPVAWTTFVHLTDQAGQIVAQKDGPTGSGVYPTSLWDAGDVIADQIILPRPGNLKAGKYTLEVGLYQLSTGQRLVIPGAQDNHIVLTTIALSF